MTVIYYISKLVVIASAADGFRRNMINIIG